VILQVAFDRVSSISENLVSPYVNDPVVQFEFGTPLVTEYGYSTLRTNFSYLPTEKIYVDTKTIDFHAYELARLHAHGYRHCSFLLGSELKALRNTAALQIFQEFTVYISTMGASVREMRNDVNEVVKLGYTYFIAHGHGINLADAFDDMIARYEAINSVPNTKIILAGGITLAHIPRLRKLEPHGIIVGRSITDSQCPDRVLRDFRDAILEP